MNFAHRVQWAVVALLVMAVTASAQGLPPQQPQTTPPPQTQTVPSGNMWSHGTTLNVFGGAAAASGDHAAAGGGVIRPEVMAHIVMRDACSFVVTTGVVRLAYHLEDHPVTASR